MKEGKLRRYSSLRLPFAVGPLKYVCVLAGLLTALLLNASKLIHRCDAVGQSKHAALMESWQPVMQWHVWVTVLPVRQPVKGKYDEFPASLRCRLTGGLPQSALLLGTCAVLHYPQGQRPLLKTSGTHREPNLLKCQRVKFQTNKAFQSYMPTVLQTFLLFWILRYLHLICICIKKVLWIK